VGAWLPQDLQARRTILRKATASVEQQLERLTDAYLHAILSRAEYQRRRQDLERNLQPLVTQVQQLDAQVDRRAETAGLATSIADFCQRVQAGLATATFTQKRTVMELLIDRVLVANGEGEIRYVLPTIFAARRSDFVICVKTISMRLLRYLEWRIIIAV
jgi:site-specific DNA recombinase